MTRSAHDAIRERRRRALRELRPPRRGTNAAALLSSPQPLCEWDPEADRPARLRDRFHALATCTIGIGGRTLRLCQHCRARTSARHYARMAPIQPGRIFKEARR